MFNWIKSKFKCSSNPPSAWVIKFQQKPTSPWVLFKVAGCEVMVRTKKEAKYNANKLKEQGVWDVKIIPVHGLI